MTASIAGRSILVTGGTGSFGQAFIERVLPLQPRRLIVYSRDELKQANLKGRFDHPAMRWHVGDVRDRDRLAVSMRHVDVVIHAAAMKRIEVCEAEPRECKRTNVDGAENVVAEAIAAKVPLVVGLSTDKSAAPNTTYGTSKLLMERLFVQGNVYAAGSLTRIACTRYGNVLGSRGSVVPIFRAQRPTGTLTITDRRMTRFWMPLSAAVDLVLFALEHMRGGEVFIPRVPSCKVVDLAEAIAPECTLVETGIRPGEKLHESLLTEDEARDTTLFLDHYVIHPSGPSWTDNGCRRGIPLGEAVAYRSDTNPWQLSVPELRKLLEEVP